MAGSALEREVLLRLASLRVFFQGRDRGVMFGFLCSLLPVFPLAWFGLLIGLFNRAMFKAGKLGERDYRLVRWGLVLACINCVLSTLLLLLIVHWMTNVEWSRWIEALPHWLGDWLDSSRRSTGSTHHEGQTV